MTTSLMIALLRKVCCRTVPVPSSADTAKTSVGKVYDDIDTSRGHVGWLETNWKDWILCSCVTSITSAAVMGCEKATEQYQVSTCPLCVCPTASQVGEDGDKRENF